jgi:hypothetical protein
MLSMPSIWELIIPTIVFFAAAWHFHRSLNEQDLPKGMTRGILVFTLATVLSLVSGAAVSWVQGKFSKAPHTVQMPVSTEPGANPDAAPQQ